MPPDVKIKLDLGYAAQQRGERARAERDRMIRLFNRLEAAISHHKKATASFPSVADEALYKARDKILTDYAGGRG